MPHRTLLMTRASGTAPIADTAEDQGDVDLFGGGRLMINLTAFSGPGNSLLDFTAGWGLVSSRSDDKVSALHPAAELNLHFSHNPLAGFLDRGFDNLTDSPRQWGGLHLQSNANVQVKRLPA